MTRRRAVRLGAGLAAAFATFCATGEMVARATRIVDRLNPFPRRLYLARSIPDLPYQLRPGVTLDVQGSHVHVNRLGMRERDDVSQQPRPGVERVLVLGDSVAFGWLQDVEHAFPRELEARLPGAEVLNAGVPGYNAVTEAAWFRESGVALAPATVVVAVNLNDYDTAPHLNGLGILSTADDRVSPLSPANWSELYLALRWAGLALHGDPRLRLARPAAPRPAGEWDPFDRYVSALRKAFYRAPTEPQWSDLRRAWADIGARARAHGTRALFVIFPDGDQLGAAEPDLTPQRALAEVCAAEHLECLDLYPAFTADPAGTALYTDIMHPSDVGHVLAAATVAAYLARERTAALTVPPGWRGALRSPTSRGASPGTWPRTCAPSRSGVRPRHRRSCPAMDRSDACTPKIRCRRARLPL